MKSFNSILYVVEHPSEEHEAAVARVVSLAANSQARLAVLHVAEEPRLGPFAGSVTTNQVKVRVREQAVAQLSGLVRGVDANAVFSVDVRFGVPFVEVVREVLRNGHDLVIKQAGRGAQLSVRRRGSSPAAQMSLPGMGHGRQDQCQL